MVNARSRRTGFGQTIDRWMVNEGERRILVFLLVVVHTMVFAFGLMTYLLADNLRNARSTLGITYPIARASALVLHFDVILLLLPVCRTLISMLRSTPIGTIIPLDKSITFHKFIAWSIVLFSWIRETTDLCSSIQTDVSDTLAHLNNFGQLSRAASLGIRGWLLANFTTGPGITGYLMILILMIMVTTALEKPRRRNFERFWFTHHLFIIFFALWQVHGSFCMITPDRAPFCRNTAVFWRFWIVGGTIYLLERIAREMRGRQKTVITKVIQHPSRVCEIQIRKDGCITKAGQYIFLCCPEISLHQYHPFTLTSAPEEDCLSIHMRCVGDFTNALAMSLGCDFAKNDEKDLAISINDKMVLPRVMLDGPFGSASEDVFKFETVMLVGAGIGVTPFASILKSIWYRANYAGNSSQPRLKKVYFFWICRDFASFEWFQSLLAAIEAQDASQMIEIHAYLTARVSADMAQNIMINGADCDVDAVTRLRAPVNFGRPAWDQIFQSVAGIHPATDVGVFFCGPGPLGSTLHKKCNQHSHPGAEGTRFVFGKENF